MSDEKQATEGNVMGLRVTGQSLASCDFSHQELRHSDFSFADLREARFLGADLLDSRFVGAMLQQANFRGARLKRVNFQKSMLQGCNLRKSLLRYARFDGALLNDKQHLSWIPFFDITLYLNCCTHQGQSIRKFTFRSSWMVDTKRQQA